MPLQSAPGKPERFRAATPDAKPIEVTLLSWSCDDPGQHFRKQPIREESAHQRYSTVTSGYLFAVRILGRRSFGYHRIVLTLAAALGASPDEVRQRATEVERSGTFAGNCFEPRICDNGRGVLTGSGTAPGAGYEADPYRG